MSTELAVLALMWAALTAYALLGGADFGAGIWDLLAGGRRAGAPRRALIEHSIGPVWEANHVWLIFVLVLMWTAFPPAFAAIASALWLPLTLIALGVIARGSAFAFRKAVDRPAARALCGAAFAFSSLVTPWFLGAAAGAVAAGRVPPAPSAGSALAGWLSPVPVVTGCFAVCACAFLAACYLTLDARRAGDPALARWFARRAAGAGLVTGACSAAGLAVLYGGAPALYAALTGQRGTAAAAAAGAAAVCGLAAAGLAWQVAGQGPGRVPAMALRAAGAGAVAAALWAWGLAQYPALLSAGPAGRGLSVTAAAAPPATLAAVLTCAAVGGALVVPSLTWLLVLFQRTARQPPPGSPPGSAAR
jgi:cytochrome d ubiquinol oxidase subunit II